MIKLYRVFAPLAVAAALLAPTVPAHADDLNAGCGTYTATVEPQPGDKVTMRPPMDSPYRATGTVVSVDDDAFLTVDRDVAEDITTRHEYVRFCDTEEAGVASEFGYWAAWPLVG